MFVIFYCSTFITTNVYEQEILKVRDQCCLTAICEQTVQAYVEGHNLQISHSKHKPMEMG